MASGHMSRTRRPHTWLLRPGCDVQKVLANLEPSTHGTRPTIFAEAHTSPVSEGQPTAPRLVK